MPIGGPINATRRGNSRAHEIAHRNLVGNDDLDHTAAKGRIIRRRIVLLVGALIGISAPMALMEPFHDLTWPPSKGSALTDPIHELSTIGRSCR